MPVQVRERAMSEAERENLRSIAGNMPGRIENIKELIEDIKELTVMFVGSWCCALVLLAFGWVFVAWLVRITVGIDFGPHSAAASWIESLGVTVCTAYFIFEGIRMFKDWADRSRSMRIDLKKKRVVEENFGFSAAMRMQEREHGGLIYFLRSTDGAVLVLFDYESQNLGVDDEDPLTSSFEPRTRLAIVRAPESGIVVGKNFSGDVLDAGDPLVLTASPNKWPEFEKVCDIPWQELEARFCR